MDHVKAIGMTLAVILGTIAFGALLFGISWLLWYHPGYLFIGVAVILVFGMYRSFLNDIRRTK